MQKSITLDEQVNLERVQQLFSQAYIGSLGSVSCAIIVFFILKSGPQEPIWLNIWLLGIVSVSVFRTYLTYQFKIQSPVTINTKIWANQFIALEWVAGILWGIVAFGFINLDFIQQLSVGIIMAGLVAGASVTFSPYFLAAVGFNIPSMSILALSFGLNGSDHTHGALAVVCIVFSTLMSLFSRNINHRIIHQITLSITNEKLTEELRQNNRQMRQDFEQKEIALNELGKTKNELESLNLVYDRMLQNLPVGIVHLDQDLRITFMNPEMQYILGVPEGKNSPAIGKIITDIDSMKETRFIEAMEVLVHGKNSAFQSHFTSLFGKETYISANIISLKNKNIFCGGLMLVQDISSQVRAHETILAAKQDAEEANQAKSLFLANVSHELRTPLHGILGASSLLKETSLNSEQQGYQEIISNTGQSLLETVNQILSLSLIEKGMDEPHFEPCDIRQFIPQTFKLLIEEIELKGLEFHFKIDDDLPEKFMIGTFHLQHVLQNMLHNACKFTNTGSISLTITGRPIRQNKYRVEFSVTDTGIGITRALQSKVFDTFTQLDQGTQRQYAGTGLGMAIAKQMAGQLGAQININSTLGKGSTFSFALELDVFPGSDKRETDRLSANKPAKPDKLHVLVVDDNAVNRMIARKLLNKRGFHADEADSGETAIDLVKKGHYDVILMDIDMPYMDGIEATRQIRQITPNHLPIIAMTAHTMQGDRERFLNAGMDDYIAKPFIHDELVKLLHTHAA